ncbi:MAG: DNA photolyase [Leptospira sp.]|nr:DNA photolyase [Leptospira sp.]
MNKYPAYSTIYIENGVENSPVTKRILEKLPKSNLIYIHDYKEVFNRPNQNFQAQKLSPKLILARKKDNFLYKGSSLAPDFGEENFFYNALLLNCPYNCDYCYLQGMYSSGNIVLFVNIDDYFEKTDEYLKRLGRIYLCLSYDTDLLGMESWTGYSASWIEFARLRPNLILELRTKSANWRSIQDIKPIPNLILAWTLSPQNIVEKYEKKTASLPARIKAISSAMDAGWDVRVCIDPILDVPGWKEEYSGLVNILKESGVLPRVREVSLGSFRMNKDYFARVKNLRKDSHIYLSEFITEDGASFYPLSKREEMVHFLQEKLI